MVYEHNLRKLKIFRQKNTQTYSTFQRFKSTFISLYIREKYHYGVEEVGHKTTTKNLKTPRKMTFKNWTCKFGRLQMVVNSFKETFFI